MTNNVDSIFVAAFDDRYLIPHHIIPFILNTTKYCDLNFITPKRYLKIDKNIKLNSKHKLNLINPSKLPKYDITKRLFNKFFVNYSTNNSYFERACFHRWFALNASTTHLKSGQVICLLDTDFLIGMNPKEILSDCVSYSNNGNLQFIAEWDEHNQGVIGPEITLMTKSYLFDFCKFLLTKYYASEMRSNLLSEYFDRIGKGLYGGICDMRALSDYAKNYKDQIFNLRELNSKYLIRNFNSFLKENIEIPNWKISIKEKKQILYLSDSSKDLIGIHFQGDAKFHMDLILKNKELTDKSVIKNNKSVKVNFKKKINKFINLINLFIKTFTK